MKNFFNILSTISGILLVVSVLIQNRGQNLGVSFGGDSSYFRSRRGAELVVFNASIILAVVFVLTVILGILVKK